MKGKFFIVALICVAAVAAACLIALVAMEHPRTLTINTAPKAVASTTNVIASATTTTTSSDPSATIAQATTTVLAMPPVMAPIVPVVPVDKVAYDQKILALANLVRVSTTTLALFNADTTASTTPYVRGLAWPVQTVYPNAGAILPFNRIVAYYGNLYSRQMGVLGEYPQAQVLAMLASTTAMWAAADPSTPVIPALDYIAVAAQASAGSDGKYRLEMPDGQINQILNMAAQAHGIVFLDIQVGLSNVETEVPVFEKYLAMPNVELSLDPEFDMHDGARPGTVIGTMDASDINWAANYLANLVNEYNLPPKILVVHRFTDDMVTHTAEIKPLPEVQFVMDMDGFGFPAKKINTYQQVIIPHPVQFTGFKLFYKNDIAGPLGHLMTPAEVLKLSPSPSYVQYQ